MYCVKYFCPVKIRKHFFFFNLWRTTILFPYRKRAWILNSRPKGNVMHYLLLKYSSYGDIKNWSCFLTFLNNITAFISRKVALINAYIPHEYMQQIYIKRHFWRWDKNIDIILLTPQIPGSLKWVVYVIN